MIKSGIRIYLASKSPRRRKLLKQLNIKFKSFSVNLNEIFIEKQSPLQNVLRICKEKMSLAKNKIDDGVLITCDTIVVINNEILGKPSDKKEAFKMLKKLSGKTHLVYTAYCIYNKLNEIQITNYEKTKVTFRKLTDTEILEYIDTGSPLDKAGAYGIQDDFGAVFVKRIEGCYYNVVGLPLSKFYHDLLKAV
ncbi:MAG: Maf family protein [Ignavibacterium sp.]|nr:Maf family protein [Ignavibacterium sp.]